MTGRVLMGEQTWGDSGLWVSRPGVEVRGAAEEQMLLSTTREMMQVVASGVINNAGNNANYDFAIPNLGYKGLVLCSGGVVTAFTFPNLTTLRISTYTSIPNADGSEVRWALLRQRIPI
jgi:hypothetical protein